jgi:hypothetical protein
MQKIDNEMKKKLTEKWQKTTKKGKSWNYTIETSNILNPDIGPTYINTE